MTSAGYYSHERFGSGNAPPLLYDTSTSTAGGDADSSSTSSFRRHQQQQQQQQQHIQHNADTSMLSSNYISHQQQRHPVHHSFPRVRKTMSDSGVSMEYDRYRRPSPPPSATSSHTKRGSPTSDIVGAGGGGGMSVSDQIRTYNRRHRNAGDPAREFVDYEYHHEEQLSYGTGTSPRPTNFQPKTRIDDDDPIMKARQLCSPNRSSSEQQRRRRRVDGAATNITPESYLSSPSQYHGDVRSKARAILHHQNNHTSSTSKQQQQQKQQHRQGPMLGDPDGSFGSSSTTPSVSSIRDLKKQLWNEREVLQVGSKNDVSMGRLDQKLQRTRSSSNNRPSRSLSPARRIVADNTFDSENTGTASFKSKYVEAAMVARDRGQPSSTAPSSTTKSHNAPILQEDGTSTMMTPVVTHTRRTTSRPRTNSGGDETQASSLSSPYDEGGRSRQRSTSRKNNSNNNNNNARPSSLNMPPLHSSFDEYAERKSVKSYNRPPPPPSSSRSSSPYIQLEMSHSRSRSPSVEGRLGRHQETTNALRSRSLSRDRIQEDPPAEPRRRPSSPLIQQRIREFSQEPPRGRTPSRGMSASASALPGNRSYSHEPRPQIHPETSLERSASLVGRAMYQTSSTIPSPKVPIPDASTQPRQLTSNAVSNYQSQYEYGSERVTQETPIRRMTVIRDAPTKRSSPLENRPPTPINQSTSIDAPSQASEQESITSTGANSRSQQHAHVAAYWHEKARASPTFPMPDQPVALMNQSSDYARRLHSSSEMGEGRTRSTESGSSFSDQQNVSELVAKLSAVSRTNPAAALAQIDSILRQESRSSSTDPDHVARGGLVETGQRESPHDSVNGETASEMDDDDDDSDDETSVSSMTNPTFQSSSKHQHNESLDRSSLNQMAPDFQGQQALHQFSPSTSSFRRPRPSALQSYIPANLQQDVIPTNRHRHEEGTSMSKAKERREQLRQHPPPLTIKVRDSQESSSPAPSWTPSENEDRFKITVKEDRNAISPPLPASTVEDDRVEVTVTQQDKNSNDSIEDRNFMLSPRSNGILSDTKMLESKIRGWDQLSQGKRADSERRNTRYDDSAKKGDPPAHRQTSLPAPSRRNRPHPWDGEIPASVEKVETRETSMEDAMGFEAAMPSRRPMMNADDSLLRSPDISLTEERPKSKANSNASIMTALRQKSVIEEFPDDSADSIHPSPQERQLSEPQSEVQLERHQSPNTHDAWATVQAGNFFPEETPLIPDPQPTHHNAPGESWITPPKNDTPQKKDARRRGGPVDLDQTIDTHISSVQGTIAPTPPARSDDREGLRDSLERGKIEVSLVSDEDGTDFADTSGDTSDNLGIPPTRHCIQRKDPSKTKRRGFLRAFMRKDKSKEKQSTPSKKETPMVQTPSPGSGSAPPSNAGTGPQIRLQPLSPAFYPEPEVDQGRGRSETRQFNAGPYGGAPQRSRSASMERFRSSNMARKFGKVLRLYDQD